MKKLYFGTNLKMYKSLQETIRYLRDLDTVTSCLDRDKIQLFVIPSYTALESAASCTDQSRITLGAQNMCWEDQGQFTGEISPVMLDELGIHLVMVGHSERRHIFGETDIQEQKKVRCALDHGFQVLLCVGETQEEKDYRISDEVLQMQLKMGLYGVSSEEAARILIAYEPVWAIGEKGLPPTTEYAEARHKVIRRCLMALFGDSGAEIPLLYGGSVNLTNARELIVQPHIEGLFVGRSAWQPEEFQRLIQNSLEACRSIL